MLNKRKSPLASKQAPWRRQAQMIAFILGLVAIFGLVAALFLDVTARAATAGRSVQTMQSEREELEQTIEDKQSQLATLRSVNMMRQRAETLGFEQIAPINILYIEVPGYTGKAEAKLAPSPGDAFQGGRTIAPEYTQSLFEWIASIISTLGGF